MNSDLIMAYPRCPFSPARPPRRLFPALRLGLAFLASWAGSPHGGAAPAFDHGPVLTLTEENDFVHGTDRWYSGGSQIVYLHGEDEGPARIHAGLDRVPALGFTPGASRFGFDIGQSIFTPANTHTSQLQLDDRPFAGWLYAGFILQRRGLGWGDHLTSETFHLQLGIIGPHSFADNLQTAYHRRTTQGWKHQLKDEPAVALKYGRAWLLRMPADEPPIIDFIPQAGLSAGNADTSFRVGGTLRIGWNLPDDFGIQPVESVLVSDGGWSASPGGRRWGFYLFTGAEGRAVLYSAFLDGNIFRESHHVDKEPFVGEWRSGLVVALHRVELAYTHVLRTAEFQGQPEGHVYGSLSVRVKF